uniref:Cytochrome p450 n=1 Tax=Papaver somniferum TaxID=3469 RepID=A0A5B7LJU5_PAPSO|nr:cytochrome p450 [Papaver somniferum]
MELLNLLHIPISLITAPFLLGFLVLSWKNYGRKSNNNQKQEAPDAPGGRPIMGHLHLFDEMDSMHRKLGSMADEYGPAFTIRLGSHKTLVVDLRTSEVDSSFKSLYSQCKGNDLTFSSVRLDSWLGDLAFNVIARIVIGKKNFATNGAERYKAAMQEAMRLVTVFAFADVFPALSWLDNLQRIDGITSPELEQDFIDSCLDNLQEISSLPGTDPDIVIKLTCLDTIMNGSDTLALTLTWAISLLLNHPDALKKAQEELDARVGKDRKVEESDIQNLAYIPAIIKETMRLYPVGPLSRSTVEDCEVGGYHVPAGTRLLVNLWKMQRDGNVYKDDPLEFRPERFLTSNADVDLKGQHYELLPFGAGRRICPGVSMSVQLLHLILARVIHEFEITTEGKVDMSERIGFLFYKKMPLEVLIRPRLSGVGE